MIARLVECSDHDYQYGILIVENVSVKEVQDKIYEIKNKFYDEGFGNWYIDDVFKEFPEEWKWEFVYKNQNEIIEI